ncbi:LuxR C-terminal-related transcriptional regulator [Bradyrhizobium sp. DASA03005]|uniref:LuxR C-terminal-related transcriptional regulator n=1 Tax=Bradyrhizobium sp. SPXBL-02 TaxID=3395912 RepID=UPI003F71A50E
MEILVVDDHPIICDGLKRYLEQTASVPVNVRTLNTLKQATDAIESDYNPDFVFLDLNLDSENQSIGTLERFQEHNARDAAVVVFTGISPRDAAAADVVRSCLGLKAKTVIFKGADIDQMFVGLERILAGEAWIPHEVVSLLLKPTNSRTVDLSPRQWDVARGVSKGLRNKQIANELNTTEANVRQIVTSIYKRLNINSRVALADVVKKAEIKL